MGWVPVWHGYICSTAVGYTHDFSWDTEIDNILPKCLFSCDIKPSITDLSTFNQIQLKSEWRINRWKRSEETGLIQADRKAQLCSTVVCKRAPLNAQCCYDLNVSCFGYCFCLFIIFIICLILFIVITPRHPSLSSNFPRVILLLWLFSPASLPQPRLVCLIPQCI